MSTLLERLDPGFISPIWLAVGLVAVIAIGLLEIGARRRRNDAVKQFAASHLVATLTASVSPFKRVLKRVLLISAVALLFVAMARPYLFYDWKEETRSGLDILLAVDCSKSMLTEDVKPSRLERAKLAIADFAEHLPDNRLGLIAFAGDAFLQCPLTLDRDAFQTAVRELDTDTIPRPGTDVATAIQTAVQATASQPNNAKVLILVTDGEDLEGRTLAAAKAAAQAGLKIYTVGVGTPGGGPITERDESGAINYHHDGSGQLVLSKLDENTLKEIATITGGAYVQLGQRGEGLDEIYTKYIEPMPKQAFQERKEKVHIERFEWPLALAILFLMWEFLTTERRAKNSAPVVINNTGANPRIARRRKSANGAAAGLALVALGLLLSGAALPGRAASVDTAETDYKLGKYQDSLQNYRKATEAQPNRNDLQYNRGAAAYKAGEFNEAEDAFRKALNTPDLNLQQNTYYNLGNTQFRHGEALEKVDSKKTIGLWEQALRSYDSSLKLKNSADARHNYEVVKQRLEQLKQQQQQKDEQEKNNQQKQDQDKDKQKKDSSGQDQKGGDKQGQGQNKNNQPGGNPGDKNPENGQDPSRSNNPGNKGDQDKQPGQDGKDSNGQQSNAKDGQKGPTKAYSGTRSQDKVDPGAKSRQEAEDLLDSLKDDERHVTARTLTGNNNEAPPPPSGRDW